MTAFVPNVMVSVPQMQPFVPGLNGMGNRPQPFVPNAPMMTKQPQKHAANQYVDNRGGVPHVDVASAAVGRMNYGAATSSGQPSPIISTKRVP